MALKNYRILYVVSGNIVIRETQAVSFLSATINAGLDIRSRPSLNGATIREIEEVV